MAIDAFLSLPSVQGEVTVKGFEGWIEVDSFSWGASNPTSIGSGTSGAGAGKVTFNPFHITKKIDKASPKLFLACCSGSHYATASMYMRKAGGTAVTYWKLDFKTVFCKDLELEVGGDDGDVPIENITFVYGAVQITYTPQKADGSPDAAIVSAWNQIKNSSDFSA
jgi:type VI secretion system secreted protein Hcp